MRPPRVDEGSPGTPWQTLLNMLEPSPGRLRRTLLVLPPMFVALAIFETFRVPEPALGVIIVLFAAREDTASTATSSLVFAAGLTVGSLIAIMMLAASLSQPALRIPLMAALTFATMFMSRASPLGMPLFIVGFFAVLVMTLADSMQSLALAPTGVSNAEGTSAPALASLPPEEVLLHDALWLGAVAAIAALSLMVANRIAGRDPALLLRAALARRLDAAAAFCRGEAGAAAALVAVGREGTAPLLKLATLAEKTHHLRARHEADERLVRALNRLVLLLIAWDEAGEDAESRAAIAPLAPVCAALARRIREGAAGQALFEPPTEGSGDAEEALPGALPALAAELRTTLEAARRADRDRLAARASRHHPAQAASAFFLPDAFAPDNTRFALKVTLAVMIAYAIEHGFDWPGISTCVVTCFFVALGTVGESLHKMTLRLSGCVVGAILGLGSIVWLMPSMVAFSQIAVLVLAVGGLSAWIANGSPRIGYAGLQLMLAFALTTLQGYGPTLDMQTARDRVVGIIVGNVLTTLCLVLIWPVRVGDAVRRDMAAALATLGAMMALELENGAPAERRARDQALRDRFAGAISHAGATVPDDRFEHPTTSRDAIGHEAVARLARLVVPVSVIVTDDARSEARVQVSDTARAAIDAHHRAMSAWFERAAHWVRTGAGGGAALRTALPAPPDPGRVSERPLVARASLYVMLHRDLEAFLDAALPASSGAEPERSAGGATLALA